MNRYRFSQLAEQDLEDIWVYLAQTGEIAADQMIAKILDRLPMLAQFPSLGRERSELATGLRSFPVKPYVIFYSADPDAVEIIRILHQSRDVDHQF